MERINYKTEEFRQKIRKIIEKEQLPIANIFLVLTIIQKDLEKFYYMKLNEQAPEQETTLNKSEIQKKFENENTNS